MTFSLRSTARPLFALFAALLLGTLALSTALAQSQTAGVDNSKMGPYRALAQHTYEEFQKGNLAAAAELARVLERVWDKSEDYGGDTALSKTNHALFEKIDKAMDEFISPLEEYKTKPPEAARVKAAFNAYLEKLKLAD